MEGILLSPQKAKARSCRYLSHECCVKAICTELPPLLQTLSQLYESSGDAEVYGIYSHLASVNGVSRSYLLSEVPNVLGILNLFMKKMIADFCNLPFMPRSTLDHLNSIRKSNGSWFTAAETAISNLETQHGIITIGSSGPTVQKLPLCQSNSFEYKWLFPTLIH